MGLNVSDCHKSYRIENLVEEQIGTFLELNKTSIINSWPEWLKLLIYVDADKVKWADHVESIQVKQKNPGVSLYARG